MLCLVSQIAQGNAGDGDNVVCDDNDSVNVNSCFSDPLLAEGQAPK